MRKAIRSILFGCAALLSACNLGWVESSCVLPRKIVFAHKGGLHEGIQPNSARAITKSLQVGFEGVEVDIMYDASVKDFIVSHDVPYDRFDGALVTFDELLKETFDTKPFYIWLDAKNLNDDNAKDYVNALEHFSNKHAVKQWMLVESRSLVANELLYSKGFKVISGAIADVRDQNQAQYYAHGVAMDIQQFMPSEGAYDIGNIPLFLFTAKTPDEIQRLLLHPGVCGVCSDLSTP